VDDLIVIVFGFGVGLLSVGQRPAFVGIDSGGSRHIFSLEGWFLRVFLVELLDDVG